MGAAVRLRTDLSAGELRVLAKRAADADQARRLLSLAAVLDGMSRKAAAEIGAMDRQTLRDWAHRYNEKGPEGLINGKAPGPRPKPSSEAETRVEANRGSRTRSGHRWRGAVAMRRPQTRHQGTLRCRSRRGIDRPCPQGTRLCAREPAPAASQTGPASHRGF